MGQRASLLLGSGPSPFEATRQPSGGLAMAAYLRPNPLTGTTSSGLRPTLAARTARRPRSPPRANPNPNPNPNPNTSPNPKPNPKPKPNPNQVAATPWLPLQPHVHGGTVRLTLTLTLTLALTLTLTLTLTPNPNPNPDQVRVGHMAPYAAPRFRLRAYQGDSHRLA